MRAGGSKEKQDPRQQIEEHDENEDPHKDSDGILFLLPALSAVPALDTGRRGRSGCRGAGHGALDALGTLIQADPAALPLFLVELLVDEEPAWLASLMPSTRPRSRPRRSAGSAGAD